MDYLSQNINQTKSNTLIFCIENYEYKNNW
jgi:hypothetical protein